MNNFACERDQITVSKFESLKAKKNTKVLLIDELNLIKKGEYQAIVLECRKLIKENRVEYKKMKECLPAITISGTFTFSHSADDLETYNSLLILDIDGVTTSLDAVKTLLMSDPHIYAIWISPSGEGLKFIIKLDSSTTHHKLAFIQACEYFESHYKIEIDKSGSDIPRLCFLSYDPDIFVNQESIPFNVIIAERSSTSIDPESNKNQSKSTIVNKHLPSSSPQAKTHLFKTEGKNKLNDHNNIRKLINYLKRTNQSITEKYSDWLKVAFAISNTFTYDVGIKYFLQICRLDGDKHDEYKSDRLLAYCFLIKRNGEVKIASIFYLAAKKGFKLTAAQIGSR